MGFAAHACGFHDPSSVNVGMLNLAYPDSLHVRTAVWMAQREGIIDRDPQLDPVDSQAGRIGALFRMRETMLRLRALHERIVVTTDRGETPGFAVVLLGPMLWTRYHRSEVGLVLLEHAEGPESNDVVVVTDGPVVAALLEGRITAGQARHLGLVRLYGTPAGIGQVVAALDGVAVQPARGAAGSAASR